MQYRGKYHVMRALQVAAALGAILGLAKVGNALMTMNTDKGVIRLGAVILFISVAVGVVASVLAKYYETKMTSQSSSDKIALDALSQLGEQYTKKRRNELK